ncbi:MAG: hypothetical protein Ta2E_12730 [Mycoplasmoidaceae bacterium]|nr:MAG: hypothetical protein Ta2E_12730 [Mycoplasmoidaceae bacterium]
MCGSILFVQFVQAKPRVTEYVKDIVISSVVAEAGLLAYSYSPFIVDKCFNNGTNISTLKPLPVPLSDIYQCIVLCGATYVTCACAPILLSKVTAPAPLPNIIVNNVMPSQVNEQQHETGVTVTSEATAKNKKNKEVPAKETPKEEFKESDETTTD